MSLSDLNEVVLLAYDAGRITASRARELRGDRTLSEFREAYRVWQAAEREHATRPPTGTAAALSDAAHAVCELLDRDLGAFEPTDPTLLGNLAWALIRHSPGAVGRAWEEYTGASAPEKAPPPPIPYPDRFPPESFTAGHSSGLGGRPETPEQRLTRAHITLLGVARNAVHHAVLQGMTRQDAAMLQAKGYRTEWCDLPGAPTLLLVTWAPRDGFEDRPIPRARRRLTEIRQALAHHTEQLNCHGGDALTLARKVTDLEAQERQAVKDLRELGLEAESC